MNNNKVLIFGGAGSLGTELTRNLLLKNKQIIIASRDEAKHWELKNLFQKNKLIKTHICDVRNKTRVREILLLENPSTIIIAQALKQVDVCEDFPEESIETNINGVLNILSNIKELALSGIYIPDNVCFVSTDKACNPINVYGMCKSIAEKTTFNLAKTLKDLNIPTKIVVTRYGNVLSSKGSIVPLLIKQAKDINVSSFTITNKEMTRFIMTLQESVDLIFYALEHGETGDLWVPKLHSMKIIDLIDIFSKSYKKDIDNIGIRPGEKIHEIMLNEEEYRVHVKHGNYFVVKQNPTSVKSLTKEYSSKDMLLTKEELKDKITIFIKETYGEEL